jgi:hypothetical protein
VHTGDGRHATEPVSEAAENAERDDKLRREHSLVDDDELGVEMGQGGQYQDDDDDGGNYGDVDEEEAEGEEGAAPGHCQPAISHPVNYFQYAVHRHDYAYPLPAAEQAAPVEDQQHDDDDGVQVKIEQDDLDEVKERPFDEGAYGGGEEDLAAMIKQEPVPEDADLKDLFW